MKPVSALLLSLTLLTSLAVTRAASAQAANFDEDNSVQTQNFGGPGDFGPRGPGPGGFGPGHGGGWGPGHGGGGGFGPGHGGGGGWGPGHGGGGGWGPGHGGGGGFGPGPASTTVSCQSNNYQAATCYTGFRQLTSIRLVQQYSSASCNYGNDFNLVPNSGAFWVSNGCRGLFEVQGY